MTEFKTRGTEVCRACMLGNPYVKRRTLTLEKKLLPCVSEHYGLSRDEVIHRYYILVCLNFRLCNSTVIATPQVEGVNKKTIIL